jgi:mono/diheme cytochrome c family protein
VTDSPSAAGLLHARARFATGVAAAVPHMICARMARPGQIATTIAVSVAAALAISGCGSQGIKIAKTSSYRSGAELFLNHCAGCHTLSVVGANGSASSVQGRLRTQAPNFDFRKEGVACVLYAIRNGGFSGQIMPQNVVVGRDAMAIAQFLAKYAGTQAPHTPTIGSAPSCSG